MSIFCVTLNDDIVSDIEARVYYYKGGMVHFEIEGDFQVISINVEIIRTIINKDYRDNIKTRPILEIQASKTKGKNDE